MGTLKLFDYWWVWCPQKGRTDDGATPLVVAKAKGQVEIVRFLVESGAKKDQGITDEATPLFAGAQEGTLKLSDFWFHTSGSPL